MESPDLQKKNNYFAGILTAKHQLYHSIMISWLENNGKGMREEWASPFIWVSNKFIFHVFMRRVPCPTHRLYHYRSKFVIITTTTIIIIIENSNQMLWLFKINWLTPAATATTTIDTHRSCDIVLSAHVFLPLKKHYASYSIWMKGIWFKTIVWKITVILDLNNCRKMWQW